MAIAATETSPRTYARFGGLLYLVIIVAGALGELSLALWLLVKGVNMDVWKDRTGSNAANG